MSYTNTITHSEYIGDGLDDSFDVTYFALDGENYVIQCALYDETDVDNIITLAPPVKDGSGDYDFIVDDSAGLQIITNNPIPVDHRLVIYRQSLVTSPVVYQDYRFPYQTATKNADRLYMKMQELDAMFRGSNLDAYWLDHTQPVSPFYQMVSEIIGDVISNPNNNLITVIPAGTFDATVGEIVATADVGGTTVVNLPAVHINGDKVIIVDKSGDVSDKTVSGNGSNIIGIGTSYELQSEYQSLTFVSDGTDWYIL